MSLTHCNCPVAFMTKFAQLVLHFYCRRNPLRGADYSRCSPLPRKMVALEGDIHTQIATLNVNMTLGFKTPTPLVAIKISRHKPPTLAYKRWKLKVAHIFFKIGVLKNFCDIHRKHQCWSLFCNFSKKRDYNTSVLL